jgi:hypothetical protein
MPLRSESSISAEYVIALIQQAKEWRVFHRERGEAGRIEVLATNIRLKALADVLKGAK